MLHACNLCCYFIRTYATLNLCAREVAADRFSVVYLICGAETAFMAVQNGIIKILSGLHVTLQLSTPSVGALWLVGAGHSDSYGADVRIGLGSKASYQMGMSYHDSIFLGPHRCFSNSIEFHHLSQAVLVWCLGAIFSAEQKKGSRLLRTTECTHPSVSAQGIVGGSLCRPWASESFTPKCNLGAIPSAKDRIGRCLSTILLQSD